MCPKHLLHCFVIRHPESRNVKINLNDDHKLSATAQSNSKNLFIILTDVVVVVVVDNIMQHISTVFKQSHSTMTGESTTKVV